MQGLRALQRNMPKYQGLHPEVYEALDNNYCLLLEQMRHKYGLLPEFYEFKHWYMEHKGIEDL